MPWRELSIATAIIVLLIAINGAEVAWRTLPNSGSLSAWAVTALGLLVSLPAAIVYHLRLARCLAARAQLDANWIWHPTRLHDRLLPEERSHVLNWFRVGAAGWAVTMGGCVWIGFSMFD